VRGFLPERGTIMADKEMEDLKKKVAEEVKQLARKTADCKKQAQDLREEEDDLKKKKDASADDKSRQVDLRKALVDLEKKYTYEAESTSERINRILKTSVPTDQKAIPEWQKGMAPWYRQMIEKEPGLDIGDGLKLSGEISIKDKKAMIFLNGKF
jgi:seryl-tRNA synthetase